MNVLPIVFNKDLTCVLVQRDDKLISGAARDLEDPVLASYRVLYDATGIDPSTIDLKFVRQESVVSKALNATYTNYISTGILEDDSNLSDKVCWLELTYATNFVVRNSSTSLSEFNYFYEAMMLLKEAS